jgi:cation:H+ antiporter
MTNLLWFIAGLILLIDGSTVFVKSAVSLASNLRISKVLIAGSIIAVGTSLPELSVTLAALANQDPSLALGNIIGSNISNVFLILSLALLAGRVRQSKVLSLPGNMLIIVTILFALMLQNGVKPLFGIALLMLSVCLIFQQSQSGTQLEEAAEESSYSNAYLVIMGVLGLVALIYGANQLTANATEIALTLGMSEFVVGIVMLAIGTSLPELAATVAALRQQESDVAVNTLVSSNLFNITLIGGIGSLSGQLAYRLDWFTGIMFIASAIVAYLVTRFNFQSPAMRLSGLWLMGIYGVYLVYIIGR